MATSNSISGNAIDPRIACRCRRDFLSGLRGAGLPTQASAGTSVRRTRSATTCGKRRNSRNPPPPNNPNMSAYEINEWNNSWKNPVAAAAREKNLLEVEIHLRPSLALGRLSSLGRPPVGIWFSRADYLSSFVSCFLPTVVASTRSS